ncbi:MAG: helix-turn-helix domain-containing protein [Gammaproteobacteria bacterium]|nr:helix-turn-helix domain-containing protein [Gammaproteobacteria bacterium]
MNDRLMTDSEAAKILGVSASFLRKARSIGVLGNSTPPPPHVQLGRAIRYRRSDLDRWLDARVVKR